MADIWCFTCSHEIRRAILTDRYVHLDRDDLDDCPCFADGEECHPMTPCRTCNNTGIVTSPDPDGESVYDSACPERVHDGEDVTFPADSAPGTPLDDWDW